MNPHPEALFWGVFTVVVAVIVITRILLHRQHKADDELLNPRRREWRDKPMATERLPRAERRT